MRTLHSLQIFLTIALLAAWHAAVARPAAAQDVTTSNLATVLSRAAASNWYIRAITAGSDTIWGPVRQLSDGATLGGLPLSEIDRIERRIKYGGGAPWGAIVGGVIGAAFVSRHPVGSEALLVGASAGAVIGAFAGHAAKPPRVRWDQVWSDLR